VPDPGNCMKGAPFPRFGGVKNAMIVHTEGNQTAIERGRQKLGRGPREMKKCSEIKNGETNGR